MAVLAVSLMLVDAPWPRPSNVLVITSIKSGIVQSLVDSEITLPKKRVVRVEETAPLSALLVFEDGDRIEVMGLFAQKVLSGTE